MSQVSRALMNMQYVCHGDTRVISITCLVDLNDLRTMIRKWWRVLYENLYLNLNNLVCKIDLANNGALTTMVL